MKIAKNYKFTFIKISFFLFSVVSYAFEYKVEIEKNEIYISPQSDDDTCSKLISDWGILLDPAIIKECKGDTKIPKNLKLDNYFQKFIKEKKGTKESLPSSLSPHKDYAAPNCFATVLKVFDPNFELEPISDKFLIEKLHLPAYINEKEFLKSSKEAPYFIEVNRFTEADVILSYSKLLRLLQPQDILLFYFNRIMRVKDDNRKPYEHHSVLIDHAAVYLINGIVFEKQNFSFDTPYEMVHIQDSVVRQISGHNKTGPLTHRTDLAFIQVLRPQKGIFSSF